MSLARTFAVVVLAMVLTTTLVTANVVAAAHLTVLDPEFVTDSMEEEGGYELIETATRDAAAGSVPTNGTGPVNTTAIVTDTISEEYVAAQAEANVDRTYAYLHGERETLNLSIATAPIRENVSDGVERQLRNTSLAELVRQSDAELDGTFNATVLERMTANQSSYQDTKAEFRQRVRDRVLDKAVEKAFVEASNDELLSLVIEDYNPREYTEEKKDQMVADREEEIRLALRDRIERERGDEIDAAVDDQLATIGDQATTDPSDAETETEAAVVSIQNTVVEGLTTDMTYQTFQSDLDESKAELAAAAAERADAQLAAELPARIDLTENMSAGAQQSFEQARTGVIWMDRLAFVLPVLVVALVGLLYFVRRSVTKVAADTGWSLLSAGVPTVIGIELARLRLQSMVADAPAEQQQAMEVMVGFAGRVLDSVGDVALVLSIAGLVLLAGSLAVRYGVIDRVRESMGDSTEDRGML